MAERRLHPAYGQAFRPPLLPVYRWAEKAERGMTADMGGDSALDMAARRLDRALGQLEKRVGERLAEAGAQADGSVDQDRARLASELDASRARERALEAAGAEASAALGQAIAQIRAALATNQEADG
jgi:hypothetical protein